MGYQDPATIMMMQQQHQHQMYEGHKSRSNSLTHQSEFSNTAATASTIAPTPASVKVTAANVVSPKVEEIASKATDTTSATDADVASTAQSVENLKLESAETPALPAEAISNGEKDNSVTESKDEPPEDWQRGQALNVEVAEKHQAIEKVTLPDAGPSSWKRGISMPEKTPAQMLLRQDGIKRFSRETIISLHLIGVNPVPEKLATLYGQLTSNERLECKPLTGSAPKSPNKGRRDGGGGGGGNRQQRHQELIDEPHPDEKTIFQNKTDVFR